MDVSHIASRVSDILLVSFSCVNLTRVLRIVNDEGTCVDMLVWLCIVHVLSLVWKATSLVKYECDATSED